MGRDDGGKVAWLAGLGYQRPDMAHASNQTLAPTGCLGAGLAGLGLLLRCP